MRSGLRNPRAAARFALHYLQRQTREAFPDAYLFCLQHSPSAWKYARGKAGLRKVLTSEVLDTDYDPLASLLDRKLTILGKTVVFKEKVNWLTDFQSGEWPNLPSFKYNRLYADDFSLADYRKHGDVKRVWDLNKQHHFVDMARAYRRAGDRRYRTELAEQFLEWNESFPYLRGIGWNHPLIVAQRAINWILCYNLDAFPEELHQLLAKSLFYHGRFIADNLEISHSGYNNNHLIGELAALHLIGLTLQNGDLAHSSLDMLLKEVKKQVYSDGVHYEQSSGYHRYVLEFLTLVWYANGRQPRLLRDVVSKMSNFLGDISWDGRTTPFLSDWDGAKVWVKDYHQPIELFKLGQSSPTSIAYPDGGYYILKSPSFHVIFDCGPIGMGGKQLGTHGHSDLLSFTLAVMGEPFIVDPGSGTYTESKEIHDYFRSTSGHNTLTLNGLDQCGLDGTWTLKKHPAARLVRWETGEQADIVSGEHDAYEPLVHRREIQLQKTPTTAVLVRDDIIGAGVHHYECYFHLDPRVLIELPDGKVRLISSSSKKCLTMSSTPALSPQKLNGLFSPDYGIWREAPVLLFEGKSDLPVRLTWKFEIS